MRLKVISFLKTLLLISCISFISTIIRLGALPKSKVTDLSNSSEPHVELYSSIAPPVQVEISPLQIINHNAFADENMNAERFKDVYTTLCKELTLKKNISEHESCPCYPDGLVPIEVNLTSPSLTSLVLEHPELSPGGIWKPKHCIARQHVAIIIPFRDRESHLSVLLNYLHSMLQRQMLHYQIFVVEQIGTVTFNKGVVMNAGFTEALKKEAFDCVIFHDVDIIPEDYRNMYTCPKYVRHIAAYIDKFRYSLPYKDAFGGAVSFTVDQFKQINGFSSLFYGWGGEDDDIRGRVSVEKMEIIRFPKCVSRHKVILHPADKTNPRPAVHGARWSVVYKQAKNYKIYGLNHLRYTLKGHHLLPLYTWMLLDVAPPTMDIDGKT